MIKVYRWTNALNLLANNFDVIRQKRKYIEEYIASVLDNNIKKDYYKFLRIVIVRSGPCGFNRVCKRPDSKPYLFNPIELQEPTKLLKEHINLYNLHIQNLLDNEVMIWKKVKKIFSDSDVDFVEIKDMYESDIIRYLQKHGIVELDSSEENSIVRSIENPEKLSDKTYHYTISELEKLLV